MMVSNDNTNFQREKLILIANGSGVMLIGLLSGIAFTFEILGAINIWPINIPLENGFPGTFAGWKLAHVAGLMNGLLIVAVAAILPSVKPNQRSLKWIVWGLVYTGWGNTIFFHLANFSSNRALAVGESNLGSSDLVSTIGYFFGATTIPLTIVAVALIGLAAIRTASNIKT